MILSKTSARRLIAFVITVVTVLSLLFSHKETLPPDIRPPIQANDIGKIQGFRTLSPESIVRTLPPKAASWKDETGNKDLKIEVEHPPEDKNWLIIKLKGAVTEELKQIIESTPDWIIFLYSNPKESRPEGLLLKFTNVVFLDENRRRYLIQKLGLNGDNWIARNLAYLYAIKSKAKVIVETNEDVIPDLKRFSYEPTFTGLIPTSRETFYNPLPHFGQSCARPKGFPSIVSTNIPTNSHTYSLQTIKTPVIQYGIRSDSNDVEFEKEDKVSSSEKHPKSIDTITPPVVIPQMSFTPFYPTVSVIHHSAFWTLFIPKMTSKLNNTIIPVVIRSCIQQRLILVQENSAMFVGLKETWTKNMNFVSELNENEKQDATVIEVVNNLKGITCKGKDPAECFLDIYLQMLSLNLISETGHNVARTWIQALQKLHYNPEDLIENQKENSNFTTNKTIVYYPKEQATVIRNGIDVCFEEGNLQTKNNDQIKMEVCNTSYAMPNSNIDKFRDILVIQLFTSLIGPSLKAVNLMYRHVFPNMLVCATEGSNLDLINELRLSFIPSYVVHKPRRENHDHSILVDCIALAMMMGHQVSGYLITHDDLMLNVWNFQGKFYDKNKVWTIRDYGIIDAKANKRVDASGRILGNLGNWYQTQFRQNISDALTVIHNSKSDSDLLKCKLNLEKQFPRNYMYYYAQIDLFYWPSTSEKDFAAAAIPFIEHRVWPEISLPSIMNCIIPMNSQLIIKFGHEYSSRVAVVWKDYTLKIKNPYFHPFKMNSMFTSMDDGKRQVFCNQVLPEISKH